MVKRISKRLLFITILLGILTTGDAQQAYQVIKDNPDIAASNYYAYPMPTKKLTPAPAGKRPFYISVNSILRNSMPTAEWISTLQILN
jgi:hypothetical protein